MRGNMSLRAERSDDGNRRLGFGGCLVSLAWTEGGRWPWWDVSSASDRLSITALGLRGRAKREISSLIGGRCNAALVILLLLVFPERPLSDSRERL